MKLSQLFPILELPKEIKEISIKGLSSDSRYAEQGDLFFALQGTHNHGLDYIDALKDRGVSVIFYEGEYIGLPEDIPTIQVYNIHNLMRESARALYQQSLKRAALFGITGTEGKTSVAMFTAQALEELGRNVGMIGTNGIGPLCNLKENTHTTPDFLALYRSIHQIVQAFPADSDVDIVLEVTSHALDQERIYGLEFIATTFLNLARDHLDYHKTVEAYREAKEKLFNNYSTNASVLNISDDVGKGIYQRLMDKNDQILFPFGEIECDHPNYLKISNIVLDASGINFVLTYQQQAYDINSHLYGHFNAYNLVAMVGNLLAVGINIDQIIQIIPTITLVKGRMEAMILPNGAVAVVDYAHKPNALLQVLKALRKHIPNGDLYCVFGCGGDRDRGKRPIMAGIAEENADYVIVTNDNPRTEDASSIADEIFTGFTSSAKNIQRILDRKEAIVQTLSKLKSGDIVLVAGKGHEDYQIIGHTKHHFSDAEVISAFIQKS